MPNGWGGARKGVGQTVLILFAAVMLSAAEAEDFEYGRPEEMAGLKRLHIDTGRGVDLHDIMRGVIKTRVPSLQVVAPTESEFGLVFRYERGGRKDWFGELHVVVPGKNKRPRLLATYRHEEEELDDLAEEIVKKFTQEYNRVNAPR